MLTRLGKTFEDGTMICYFKQKGHVTEFIRLMTIEQLWHTDVDATELALAQIEDRMDVQDV